MLETRNEQNPRQKGDGRCHSVNTYSALGFAQTCVIEHSVRCGYGIIPAFFRDPIGGTVFALCVVEESPIRLTLGGV